MIKATEKNCPFLTSGENAMLYRYLDRCGELILVRAASSSSISIHIASTIMIHDYIVQVVSLLPQLSHCLFSKLIIKIYLKKDSV